MDKMPNIVLKRKRLSKTKTVVIFRRNNLSFSDFKKIGDAYTYQEEFNHHGVRGKIQIIVESDNLYDLFEINTKAAKVKGGKDHLGIFLRFPDQKHLPLVQSGVFGCMRFNLYCNGKSLHYDSNKKKKNPTVSIHTSSMKTPISISNSVRWAATHPYQGGGVSPR